MTTTTAPTLDLSTEQAAALDAANLIRQEANANVFGHAHAHDRRGRVYGEAADLLRALLDALVGPTEGRDVYDAMIDTGEGWRTMIPAVTGQHVRVQG